MSEMLVVPVSIVGFVIEHSPNIIEFVLRDAFDRDWHFHDKVPMVSCDYFDEHSAYPAEGVLRCTVLKRYVDETGRALAVVDTEFPDGVEALDGEHVFTVYENQLSPWVC